MDKIRTGLLGYGAVAHMHMKALAACPERIVTGVYGRDREKAQAFSDLAKKKDVLLVPGDGFGCPGWFRICYCVSYDKIQRSIPVFAALMEKE